MGFGCQRCVWDGFRSMWLFIVNSLLIFWFLRKFQDLNAKKNRKLRIFVDGRKKWDLSFYFSSFLCLSKQPKQFGYI